MQTEITLIVTDGAESADTPLEERTPPVALASFDAFILAGYSETICKRLAKTVETIVEDTLALAQMLGPDEEDDEEDAVEADEPATDEPATDELSTDEPADESEGEVAHD